MTIIEYLKTIEAVKMRFAKYTKASRGTILTTACSSKTSDKKMSNERKIRNTARSKKYDKNHLHGAKKFTVKKLFLST